MDSRTHGLTDSQTDELIWGGALGNLRFLYIKIISPKVLPQNIWIFIGHYREMYYYCTPTAALTLIILTILANLCLPFNHVTYLVICSTVQLPLRIQFSCSFTPTSLYLYSSNTSPLWICFFFTPPCHSIFFKFQPLFLIADFLADYVIFTWR